MLYGCPLRGSEKHRMAEIYPYSLIISFNYICIFAADGCYVIPKTDGYEKTNVCSMFAFHLIVYESLVAGKVHGAAGR